MRDQELPPPILTEAAPNQSASPAGRFQFSLRTLMLGMALLSVLFAGISAIGPGWSILIGWCVALIAVHIAGNAWGTRNKARTAEPHPDDAISLRPRTAPAAAFAPTTRLSDNTGPGMWMLTLACLGAAAGGAVGSYLLWKPHSVPTFYVGYVVGVASASIVGGFLGYLTGSFLEIALKAWREAARHDGGK